MPELDDFPKMYRKNIKTVSDRLGTDYETAFAIILMTATLTDLYPNDSRVVEYVLADCGVANEYA